MSQRAFLQAKDAGCVGDKVDTSGLSLVTANGSPLSITGAFWINFRLGDIPCKGIFVVVHKLSSHVIIGMNVILREHITLRPGTTEVLVRGTQVTFNPPDTSNQEVGWQEAEICAVTACTISPHETLRVTCRLRNPQDSTKFIGPNTPFVGQVMGLPLFAITDEQGRCDLFLPNVHHEALLIARNQVVGGAQETSKWTQVPLTPELVASVFAERCQRLNLRPNKAAAPVWTDRQKHHEMSQEVEKVIANSAHPAHRSKYKTLLMEYADVFSLTSLDLGFSDKVIHDIQLRDKEPVYTKQFPLPADDYDLIRRNVQEWIKIGIVETSKSKYNSPVFCVRKKEGHGLRVVLDYRHLNAKSLPDRYSIKCVDECIRDVGHAGSKVFSALDLTSGFWQMALATDARPYTAFTVPGLGQFQWRTSPMGLSGCPASFARLMDMVMQDLPNVITYIDDVLIHSANHGVHLGHVRGALQRIRTNNLKLNVKKCIFGSDQVSYLGHTLSSQGVSPGLDKTKAIRELRPPSSSSEIRSFLGLANYFRNYISGFARWSAQLSSLTRNNSAWRGGTLPPPALAAFVHIQKQLVSKPLLAFPTREGAFHLYVDGALGKDDGPGASEGGLGACLTQEQLDPITGTGSIGTKRVVGYASRPLKSNEKNYSAYLLEMKAVEFGIQHFSTYLKGRKFVLYSDHKPLERLNAAHKKTLSRLQEFFQDYHFDIRYVKAAGNVAADFLSRHSGLGCAPVSETRETMADLQHDDPAIRECIKACKGLPADREIMGTYAQYVPNMVLHNEVLRLTVRPRKGIITESLLRVVAPRGLQPKLLQESHNSMIGGHGGFFKTAERIKAIYWWPGMDVHIAEHVAKCRVCQKTTNKGVPDDPAPGSLPQTKRPNERVHIDLFGSLLAEDGTKKFVLVATDAFTKIVRLSVIKDKSAESVAAALLTDWIYLYGVPKTIFSDMGLEFCNDLQKRLWTQLGVQHGTTTPYHPQCNGQVEVFNKTMVGYLRKAIEQAQEHTTGWEKFIGPLMLSHNTAVHKATMATPFYTMFGYDPKTPLWPDQEVLNFEEDVQGDPIQHLRRTQQVVRAQAHHNNQHYREQYLDQHTQKPAAPTTYHVGQLVWLRVHAPNVPNKKLAHKWEEGQIIQQLHEQVYRVKRPNRRRHKEATINARDIKPRADQVDQQDTTPEQPATTPTAPHPDSDFQEDWQSSGDSSEEEEAPFVPQQKVPKAQLPQPPSTRTTRSRARDLAQVIAYVYGVDFERQVEEFFTSAIADESWSLEDIFKLLAHVEKHKTGEEFMFFSPMPTAVPAAPATPPPEPATEGEEEDHWGTPQQDNENTPPPPPTPPSRGRALKKAKRFARELKRLADYNRTPATALRSSSKRRLLVDNSSTQPQQKEAGTTNQMWPKARAFLRQLGNTDV